MSYILILWILSGPAPVIEPVYGFTNKYVCQGALKTIKKANKLVDGVCVSRKEYKK